jgi:hypothetical protein
MVRPLSQPPRHLVHRHHLHPLGYPHVHCPDPTDRSRPSRSRRLLSSPLIRRIRQRRFRRVSTGFRPEGFGTFDHLVRGSGEQTVDAGRVWEEGTALLGGVWDGRRGGASFGYEESRGARRRAEGAQEGERRGSERDRLGM